MAGKKPVIFREFFSVVVFFDSEILKNFPFLSIRMYDINLKRWIFRTSILFWVLREVILYIYHIYHTYIFCVYIVFESHTCFCFFCFFGLFCFVFFIKKKKIIYFYDVQTFLLWVELSELNFFSRSSWGKYFIK